MENFLADQIKGLRKSFKATKQKIELCNKSKSKAVIPVMRNHAQTLNFRENLKKIDKDLDVAKQYFEKFSERTNLFPIPQAKNEFSMIFDVQLPKIIKEEPSQSNILETSKRCFTEPRNKRLKNQKSVIDVKQLNTNSTLTNLVETVNIINTEPTTTTNNNQNAMNQMKSITGNLTNFQAFKSMKPNRQSTGIWVGSKNSNLTKIKNSETSKKDTTVNTFHKEDTLSYIRNTAYFNMKNPVKKTSTLNINLGMRDGSQFDSNRSFGNNEVKNKKSARIIDESTHKFKTNRKQLLDSKDKESEIDLKNAKLIKLPDSLSRKVQHSTTDLASDARYMKIEESYIKSNRINIVQDQSCANPEVEGGSTNQMILIDSAEATKNSHSPPIMQAIDAGKINMNRRSSFLLIDEANSRDKAFIEQYHELVNKYKRKYLVIMSKLYGDYEGKKLNKVFTVSQINEMFEIRRSNEISRIKSIFLKELKILKSKTIAKLKPKHCSQITLLDSPMEGQRKGKKLIRFNLNKTGSKQNLDLTKISEASITKHDHKKSADSSKSNRVGLFHKKFQEYHFAAKNRKKHNTEEILFSAFKSYYYEPSSMINGEFVKMKNR